MIGIEILDWAVALSVSILCGIGTITACYAINDYSWNLSVGLGLYMGAMTVAFFIQQFKRNKHNEVDATNPNAPGMARP
jgi:hypothetical protein